MHKDEVDYCGHRINAMMMSPVHIREHKANVHNGLK